MGDHGLQTRGPPLRLRPGSDDFTPRPAAWVSANRTSVLSCCARPPETCRVAHPAYAELHCHSHFSFLDGASAPGRPRRAGRRARPCRPRDHRPPGPVRRGPVLDRGGGRRAAPGDRGRDRAARRGRARTRPGSSCPERRAWRPGRRPPVVAEPPRSTAGRPPRPRPERARLPGHRRVAKEDHRGDRRGAARAAPRAARARRDGLAEPVPDGVAGEPRGDARPCPKFTQALLAEHREGVVALSGCRDGELARRLRAGDREGARAVAERYAALFGSGRVGGPDVGLRARAVAPPAPRRRLARLGDRAAGRRAGAAGRGHQRRPLRPPGGPRAPGRPDGDPARPVAGRARATCGGRTGSRTSRAPRSCSRCRPATRRPRGADPVLARAWREGIAASAEIAAGCRVELAFERYRFPGFPVPKGETAVQPPVRRCAGRARGAATTR